jgi:hypothetical protein
MLDELDKWEARIDRWFQSKAYEARSDMDDMFGFLRTKQTPLILAMRSRCYEERQQSAYAFRNYAQGIKPLRYADYIVAQTDVDANRFPGVIRSWRARPIRLPQLKRRRTDTEPWHLELIGVPEAHKVTKGAGVKVAVIDTGADCSHKELAGKVVDGYDFVNDRKGCVDDNEHGTHVSGLIAGESVGVAPEVSLYVAKVLDAQGVGNEAVIALGIDWAIGKGVNLINMSLGSRYPSPLEEELINSCEEHGIVMCAAAGNEGRGKGYPAAYDGVISVAAVDRHKEHAYFSNIDDTVDVSAPGVDIFSCVPGGYAVLSGTSMASPIACGVAALIESTGCSAIEDALESSAEELGAHNEYGAGLVQANAAVVHKLFKRRMKAVRP